MSVHCTLDAIFEKLASLPCEISVKPLNRLLCEDRIYSAQTLKKKLKTKRNSKAKINPLRNILGREVKLMICEVTLYVTERKIA